MNKKIKIDFTDFWGTLNKEDNYFTNLLRKYYDVEISNAPDYVIGSSFGKNIVKYDCIRVAFIGENLCPDFNAYDYAMGFSYLNFEDRYIRLPLYVAYQEAWSEALLKHNKSESYYSGRKKFCNFIVSNPIADSVRDEMFFLLNSYKTVDSGGRYLNNIGRTVDNKMEFQEDYVFSIAFENSSTSGYTTEKIVEAFAAGTIPIYWGNPLIADEFNSEAFINCHSYDNLDGVVKQIIKIDQDENLKRRYQTAPILKPDSLANNYISEKYIIDFFDHIFSQEINHAFRRNRLYIGARYEKALKRYARVDSLLKPVDKITFFIEKKFSKKV